MFRFLAAMLGVLNKLLGAWQANYWKRQDRQEAAKEAEHEIEKQIALGEAAIVDPEPERVERMRAKYDRSRTPE